MIEKKDGFITTSQLELLNSGYFAQFGDSLEEEMLLDLDIPNTSIILVKNTHNGKVSIAQASQVNSLCNMDNSNHKMIYQGFSDGGEIFHQDDIPDWKEWIV